MKSAWAPGHATLFFAVPEKYENSQEMGSIGGGFNFKEGVITRCEFARETEIFWNNNIISGEVTKTCIDLLREKYNFSNNFVVNHESTLPIGYGLSTSGAGAIGTLLSLTSLMGLDISKDDVYKLAHKAELLHHTGLGSVVGQINSGVELRLSQGGPENCVVRTYNSSENIIIMFFGPLDTSKIITSDKMMKEVTKAGIKAVADAKKIKDNYADNFIDIGFEFTYKCGLQTKRIHNIVQQLQKLGENKLSMAMIGETIVILPNKEDRIIQWIEKNNYRYVKTRITTKKPYLMI